MNPLVNRPRARSCVYLALWVAGLVLTACQIGVAAIEGATQPSWLTVALAVFPAVAAYVGYTAQANTPAKIETLKPEGDAVDPR